MHKLLLSIVLLFGCDNRKESSVNQTIDEEYIPDIVFENGTSREDLQLEQPSIIVIRMDSLELEQVKVIDGEDRFYTATDDLLWYNNMMVEQMDSLKIPVVYTEKDSIVIRSINLNKTIVKDSTFSIFTYFLFDDDEIKRVDLFKLIGQ